MGVSCLSQGNCCSRRSEVCGFGTTYSRALPSRDRTAMEGRGRISQTHVIFSWILRVKCNRSCYRMVSLHCMRVCGHLWRRLLHAMLERMPRIPRRGWNVLNLSTLRHNILINKLLVLPSVMVPVLNKRRWDTRGRTTFERAIGFNSLSVTEGTAPPPPLEFASIAFSKPDWSTFCSEKSSLSCMIVAPCPCPWGGGGGGGGGGKS